MVSVVGGEDVGRRVLVASSSCLSSGDRVETIGFTMVCVVSKLSSALLLPISTLESSGFSPAKEDFVKGLKFSLGYRIVLYALFRSTWPGIS